MLKVMTIVGTRPEIIRLSRVIDRLDRHCAHTLVHTGQNYDYELNQIFFEELDCGNPVSIAASLTTIELLEEDLIRNAAEMGAHLMGRMKDWPHRFKYVGDVRGLGLMIGIEIVRDQHSKERAPDLRDRLEYLAFERGLLVLGSGPNTIRLCTPLVITRDQADFAIDTLEDCLRILEG